MDLLVYFLNFVLYIYNIEMLIRVTTISAVRQQRRRFDNYFMSFDEKIALKLQP